MALYPASLAPCRVGAAVAETPRRGLLAGTVAVAAGSLLATTGCSNQHRSSANVIDEVAYLTGLGATGREAHAWVADKKGFFAAEQINVRIEPGAAGDANLRVLASGRAQFTSIDYAGVVVRAGTGRFDQFRAVGVLHNRTIASIMALRSSGISTPKDLAGRRVGQATGSSIKALFGAYATLSGLNDTQIRSVRWHETQGAQLPQLLAAGKLDGIGQWVPAVPTVRAAARGAEIVVLPYSDVMSDLYGNVVVSRVGVAPDLQRRFVRALWRGLRYAVDHPDEAGEILHSAVPTTDAAVAADELRLLRSYVSTPQATPEMVAKSIALMQSIGRIPAGDLKPERVFDFGITTAVPSAGV